jgi:hypothetical protein
LKKPKPDDQDEAEQQRSDAPDPASVARSNGRR